MAALTPKIEEQINQQGFEVIETRIKDILLCEIDNQKTLQSLPELTSIVSEDMNLFDNSQEVKINVSINTVDYRNVTERQAEASADFYIDCYVSAKDSATTSGSERSRSKLHTYLGFCRYILQSTKYKRLGFEDKTLILGTTISTMQYEDTFGKEDMTYSRMARLTFTVRYIENQELWQPVTLEGLDTEIQPDGREDSYQITLNN